MDQDFSSVSVWVIAQLELGTGLQDTALQHQTISACHCSQHKGGYLVGSYQFHWLNRLGPQPAFYTFILPVD